MIKEHSCRQCGVQIEYTGDFSYIGALYGHCMVSRLKITNTSGRDWRRMTVSLTSAFIKTQVRVYDGISSGESVVVIPDSLDVDLDRLYHIGEDYASELRVVVSGDDDTYETACFPIKIHTRNYYSGDSGHLADLAAFVDPGHTLVGELAAKIAVSDESDLDSFGRLRRLVGEIYDRAKDLDISYRDVFFRADKGQEIATLDVIDSDRQGNSLDIALLLCSCLERQGVRSSLIYFNSSVIVGAWTDDVPAPDTPVVESAEGIYGLIASDRPQLVLVDPSGIASGKDFEDANYSANKLLLNEDPRYLIDIAAARSHGVMTMVAPRLKVETPEDKEKAENVFALLKERGTAAVPETDGTPFMPYLLDSSQIAAVAEAGRGASLVLDAPAGERRMQTVVSMIADAVCRDRRVLCVCADDVSRERIKRSLDDIMASGDEASDVADGDFGKLTAMFDAVHRHASDGLSLYDVVEKYYGIDGAVMEMSRARAKSLDSSEAGEIAGILRSFDSISDVLGKHPSRLPLAGIYPRVRTSRGQARIEAFLEEFPRFVRRAKRRERSLLNRWFFHHDAMHYLDRIEQWNTFRRLVVIDERLTADIDTIAEAVARWHKSKSLFADWSTFADEVVSLNRLGAFDTLEYYLDGHSGKETANAFLKGYYLARGCNALRNGDVLRDFDAARFESEIDACRRELEDEVSSCRKLYAGKSGAMPTLTTVRNLPADMGAYDVVFVVDADMIVADALAAIVESAGLIVLVGDSRVAAEGAMLSQAVEAEVPQCTLRYADAVGHESLSQFAGRTFYGGKMITFPSADDCCRVVHFIDPAGTFDRATNTNIVEARAVVERLRGQVMDAAGEKEAVSVAAVVIGDAQCELTARLWSDAVSADRTLKAAIESRLVSVSVTRLRDVRCDDLFDDVVLSVGYAPDSSGRVLLDIDGISGRHGDRLVNMASSCARRSLTVLSSLRLAHIPADEVMPYGVRVFRSFLAYAMDPSRLDEGTGSVSAVVRSISDALRQRGLVADINVGRSGWRVDIAVRNPDDDSRYMFGIIVDGRNYESLPTVADRDIVVPGVLASLGWDVKRVWAVEWFSDSDAVLARLLG